MDPQNGSTSSLLERGLPHKAALGLARPELSKDDCDYDDDKSDEGDTAAHGPQCVPARLIEVEGAWCGFPQDRALPQLAERQSL